MTRLPLLAAGLVLALGGSALAQSSPPAASLSGTVKHSTGLATPPPGTLPPQPKKLNRNAPNVLSNVPTLPQIALHPTATVGSSVPMSGPGGTTPNPAGY